MAEEDKTASAWYKVPTWDGSPLTWRAFEKEMQWWVSSLDLEATRKYNLAARWLLRQQGVVRQRGEEFTPKELEFQREVKTTDPDGVEIVVVQEDLLAGLNKLLKALETINGKTPLDRKGELRNQFYLGLQRRAGERPADFMSRFRSLTSELRAEGIALPAAELGWFLREKLGLDPLRKQLLETALQGRENYEDVETEALRLFKELHAADPLFRRAGLEQRGRGRGHGGTPSVMSGGFSSTRTAAPSTMSRGSAATSGTSHHGGRGGGFQQRRFPYVPRPRQAYAAEMDEEAEVYEADAAEEEELVADESPHEAGLDELLENEAEALAAELDQAERDGCDEAVLGQLEDSYGNAAEALVSMREARAQLQAVRKDRGFGKAPSSGTRSGPSSPSSGGPAMKKRGLCWDCGLQGHWAGDAACAKPGAGLFKKTGGKGAGSSGPQAGSSPTRRVHLTETLAVETGAGDEENERVHEVSVASTLEEALEISEANAASITGGLPADKKLVGALDSACNRTVCGRAWYEDYVAALRRSPCWQAVGHLLGSEAERETFKFGNDGTKPSYERKRLPMLVGDSLILVWTSVVEVGALGLLLGRDFLEAIGGVISFTRRALRADHLDGRRVPLKQLAAGHLYLDMFPALRLEISEKRWKRQGVDGVIEVQVSNFEWCRRRAAALKPFDAEPQALALEATQANDCNTVTSSMKPRPAGKTRASKPVVADAPRPSSCRAGGRSLPTPMPTTSRKKPVALRWASALVAAAALSSLCSASLRQRAVPCAVEGAGRKHGEERCLTQAALQAGAPGQSFRQPGAAEGWSLSTRPPGNSFGLLGGPHAGWDVGGEGDPWDKGRHTKPAGGQAEARGGREARKGRSLEGSQTAVGTSWWASYTQGRSPSTGRALKCGGRLDRDRGQDQAATAPHGRRTPGDTSRRNHDLGGSLLVGPRGKDRPSTCTTGRPTAGRSSTTSTAHGRADAGGRPRPQHCASRGGGDDGATGQPDAGHAGPDDAAHDGHGQSRATPPWGRSPVAGQQHGVHGGRSRDRPVIPPLRQQLKQGQRLMIGQAWGKYSRDRKLLKATAQDVREAFETVAAQDYDAALAEPFVGLAGNWPYPSRPSLGHTLLAAARHRGHQVTTASLQSFDRRPFFMCFRLAGPSPLLNFSGKQARLDAEKKNLESEAAVLQAAMAQRRSGRHFLIEFGRGARPDRTPEGKELLEELGEADFVMNGRRYVTSSPSFVTALRAGKDAALDDLAAMTLQGIERQFDEDHQAGNVHEGLAAETFDGDGSLLDLEEDESDVDEPGPVTEEERTVKAIPVAVRQAVRRLHENTGHRSPLRLARALVIAGAPPEAILAAKQLKCSLCDERRPPKVQRPASLPGPRDPGDQVGIDIFDVFDGVGTRFSVLHAVDAATRFQMAVLVERKASEEVVNFIRERWAPVFGVPRTLVCDQGREFISHELEDFASGVNMHLYHIAVGAPWQNGLCERTGGILKTLVSACVAARSLMGTEEMKVGLAEGLLAYNMDVGDSGFSPMQAAVGRQPMLPGDALGGGRLGELEALENPSYARLMAVREAAKMAMLRLHFSRSLKRAEKARSRNPTLVSTPAVGDLVYYWREQKYNKRASYNKRRLLLKKWHGPALLVAFEGSNCYVTARGTLTKVALEHVRRASAMEQLASGEWESVLQEIVDAAARDQEWEVIPRQGSGNSDGGPPPPGPPDGDDGPGLGEQPTLPEPTRGPMAPSTADGAPALGHLGLDVSDGAGLEQPTVPEPGGPLLGRVLPFRDQLRQAMSRGQEQRGRDLPPVSTGEFVKATSGSAAGDSRRPSTLLGRRVSGASSSRAPGTPVPECILGAGGGEERSPVGPFEAETEPDGGSTKRPAELDAETLRDKAQGSDDTVPFDAMVMERSEVLAAAQAREGEVHPLVKLQAQAAMDRLSGDIGEAGDHGTWDGRWPLPSRTEYEAFVQAGLKWPTTRDAFVVQAARKEYHWSSMGPEQKAAFKDAAAEAWNVWLRNEAVEVLSDAESEKVWATLRQRGELHKVLTPRFVYTDKNDGQRTQQNNLPLKASARLVVPGYKDITAYGLRKDPQPPAAPVNTSSFPWLQASFRMAGGWAPLM